MSDCEHTGYSHKNGRLYCRAFNHQEARDLRAQGLSYAAIGERLGVTLQGIRLACDPEARKADYERSARYLMGGTCPDCGKQGTSRYGRRGGNAACRDCETKRRRTSVALNPDGAVVALKCVACHEWKGVDKFPARARKEDGRRGNQTCTACGTKLRQMYRDRSKVPCETCGAPCLPPSEKGRGAAPVARCLTCYRASRKKAAA